MKLAWTKPISLGARRVVSKARHMKGVKEFRSAAPQKWVMK